MWEIGPSPDLDCLQVAVVAQHVVDDTLHRLLLRRESQERAELAVAQSVDDAVDGRRCPAQDSQDARRVALADAEVLVKLALAAFGIGEGRPPKPTL